MFVVVVGTVAALSGCQPMGEKADAFQRADVERRAEVMEAEQERFELSADQRVEQAELTDKLANEWAELNGHANESIEVADKRAAEAHAALRAERASFLQASLDRLELLGVTSQSVIDKAALSDKSAVVVTVITQDASEAKAKAASLTNKLPALLQVTSDATWTMTRDSVDEQIDALETAIAKLDRRL
ncbi:MAG: hypothetical protein Q8O67_18720 [Deltaproteobacteria bacterium]|nr:hypothetical protein [Deltaproteobacteria bacterium]